MRGPLELRLVLVILQDVRLGLHQLRLEASSCSAQELTAPDTEHPATGLACHDCWHGEGTASRTGLPCRQPARPPGMATGGRPTHRRAAPGARAEEIMAGSSAVSVGRNATRAARTAIEVSACQRRNDLVPDQILFDLRIPVVARCSPTPPAR